MDRLDVSGRKVGMDRHVVRQAQEYVFTSSPDYPVFVRVALLILVQQFWSSQRSRA